MLARKSGSRLIQLNLCGRVVKGGRLAALTACWSLAQGALAGETQLSKAATTMEAAGEKAPWMFAYFRQRYEGRVELDAEGRARQVPLPNPMKEEQLHLALSTRIRSMDQSQKPNR